MCATKPLSNIRLLSLMVIMSTIALAFVLSNSHVVESTHLGTISDTVENSVPERKLTPILKNTGMRVYRGPLKIRIFS